MKFDAGWVMLGVTLRTLPQENMLFHAWNNGDSWTSTTCAYSRGSARY